MPTEEFGRLVPEDTIKRLDIPKGTFLDGELYWHGSTQEDVTSAVKRRSEDTKKLHFNVFDINLPNVAYTGRIRKVIDIVGCIENVRVDYVRGQTFTASFPSLPTTQHHKEHIKGLQAYLKICLNDYLGLGYEGIVIRAPKGYYTTSPHGYAFKLKPIHDDEGICIGVERGKCPGKYSQTTGALIVKWKDKTIRVSGMTDKQRDEFWTNPPIEKTITFKYNGLSKYGTPIHPRFVAVRPGFDRS